MSRRGGQAATPGAVAALSQSSEYRGALGDGLSFLLRGRFAMTVSGWGG